MKKESETEADFLNAYTHEYLSCAGGEGRDGIRIKGGQAGSLGERYRSSRAAIHAKGRALYEYFSQGPDVGEKERGKSIACEIITYTLLGGAIFEGGHEGYLVLFTPFQLDVSANGSRGFDLLVARQTNYFNNGQYVKDGILGIDVTRSVNWPSIQKKTERHHFRSEIKLPVIVLPMVQLPEFADFMEAYRQDVVSGKIRLLSQLPQEFQHMEGVYHEQIIDIVLGEITRIKKGLKEYDGVAKDKLGDFEKFLLRCREK